MPDTVKNEKMISDEELNAVSGGGHLTDEFAEHKGHKCRIYQADSGENLYAVAFELNVSASLIMKLNDIKIYKTVLKAGQRLYIPMD